jgi:hypothetical protein
MAKAQNTFTIGLVGVVGSTKYTSEPMKYNGVQGRMWTKRVQVEGGLQHVGKQFVRDGAEEVEVTAAFDDTDE